MRCWGCAAERLLSIEAGFDGSLNGSMSMSAQRHDMNMLDCGVDGHDAFEGRIDRIFKRPAVDAGADERERDVFAPSSSATDIAWR